ncbi:hypothetical protein HU200_008728 [Digitaria exilis]|uniref:F-box domain-containing protein n=1 Tax=Digitaria exilis TaxID=1010633 RepID=A0A835FMY4_9POAL|nr:hypothetical protein HU200_008728 [Digitaria exilis]
MDQPIQERHRPVSPKPSPSAISSGSVLPDDILFFHILQLLPVKCIVRLQVVCKSWQETIGSTHFMRRHLEHSMRARSYTVSSFSFHPGQSNVAKLIFIKRICPYSIPMFSIPIHCDGLVLIPCITGEMFMCNPATREFVQLPLGTRSIGMRHRAAFGFDPWSGTYKVALCPILQRYSPAPLGNTVVDTRS